MKNKQIKANIKELDLLIGNLTLEVGQTTDEEETNYILERLEKLTTLRSQLNESLELGSYKKEVITGLIGIGSMILVLKYEKADVITSKAYSLATKMFRG